MAENLYIPNTNNKADIYEAILPQISALIKYENSRIASLANISAILKEAFNFFWVGFYIIENSQLVLGPFQGTLACSRINFGKGVCGTAWKTKETQLVEDVEQFPGHIACSSLSKSEIVVPIFKNGEVVAILDIDSDKYADFDDIDNLFLNKLCDGIGEIVF
ncbi:MAG: GAF domain-containing protein [Rikenellaceae bacterium]